VTFVGAVLLCGVCQGRILIRASGTADRISSSKKIDSQLSSSAQGTTTTTTITTTTTTTTTNNNNNKRKYKCKHTKISSLKERHQMQNSFTV
jgi:Tfp pilus assembly major pilin PilA